MEQVGGGNGQGGPAWEWPAQAALVLVGVGPHTAPLAVRERVAVPPDRMQSALVALKNAFGQGVILSTCLRTEVYSIGPDPRIVQDQMASFLGDLAGLPVHEYEPFLDRKAGGEVSSHLFSVSAGLDSIVVGEEQILGQVRDALAHAQACGTAETTLSELFRQAIAVGKRAHREAHVRGGMASIGAAAAKLAKRLFVDFGKTTGLVIGAGKMASVTAEALHREGLGRLVVASRRRAPAADIALRCGGQPEDLSRLLQLLAECDFAISATAAPHYIVTEQLARRVVEARQGRPLAVIDIALPRDVEPSVRSLPAVTLYDLDDLGEEAAVGLMGREQEIERVKEIVAKETLAFHGWLATRQVAGIIARLCRKTEAIRVAEIQRALTHLDHLSEEERHVIDAMSRAMVNKFLHAPIVRLRESTLDGDDGRWYAEAFSSLFALFALEEVGDAN